RGEDAVRCHATQEPQARDAGARADLGDRLGLQDRGEETESAAGARADRDDADLLGASARVGQVVVLGQVPLGELKTGCTGHAVTSVRNSRYEGVGVMC